ncbi:hypothetical protein [Candidatus Vallotia lariciata]|nr:hypothetical protein [Candidatus Vallotia lariciata]
MYRRQGFLDRISNQVLQHIIVSKYIAYHAWIDYHALADLAIRRRKLFC